MQPKFGNSERSFHNSNFRIWLEKSIFFEGCSWFKFNNLRLALSMVLKFYTSEAKGLKLKVRKFLGLIPTFVEVTGEKLVEGGGAPPMLNRVKSCWRVFRKYLTCTWKVTSSKSPKKTRKYFLSKHFNKTMKSRLQKLVKLFSKVLKTIITPHFHPFPVCKASYLDMRHRKRGRM